MKWPSETPEVRKGRKRAMRAKTKEETYKRKTGTPRIRPRRSIVSSPLGELVFPGIHFRNANSLLLISPSRKARDSTRAILYLLIRLGSSRSKFLSKQAGEKAGIADTVFREGGNFSVYRVTNSLWIRIIIARANYPERVVK